VNVKGVDKDYLFTSGENIEFGRNFTTDDIQYGQHMAIIGTDIAKTLFKNNENPLGKIITVGSGKYQVVGILKEKGSSMGFSGDRSVWIPINNVRQYFSRPNMNYKITVLPRSDIELDAAIGEATGVFRVIRNDKLGDDSSFAIIKSDNLADMLLNNLKIISYAATFIGLITLAGAAIGLMNIMLVSVTERTKEIGIRKVLGSTAWQVLLKLIKDTLKWVLISMPLPFLVVYIIMNEWLKTFANRIDLNILYFLAGGAIVIIIAVLAVSIKSIQIARSNPVDSLRYE